MHIRMLIDSIMQQTASNDFPSYCNGAELTVTSGDFTVVTECDAMIDEMTQVCP